MHVKVTKNGDRIHFDFSGCSDQTQGPANIRPPLVRAACAYCLGHAGRPLPADQSRLGTRHRNDLSSRQCRRPAVSRGRQYLYADRPHRGGGDSAAPWLPSFPRSESRAAPAARRWCSAGAMPSNNRAYVHYEIFSGGTGARSGKDGVSATAFHLSNCKTAPIEIIESEFPARVERFEMIPGLRRQRANGAAAWVSPATIGFSPTTCASRCAPTNMPSNPGARRRASRALKVHASSIREATSAKPPAVSFWRLIG